MKNYCLDCGDKYFDCEYMEHYFDCEIFKSRHIKNILSDTDILKFKDFHEYV